MAQSNYNIANQNAPAFRGALNDVLLAIASNNSGATAPGTTFAYQWWYDTTANVLKMRNAADDGWISIATFNQGAGTFRIATEFASQAEAEAGTDTLKAMNALRTRQAIDDRAVFVTGSTFESSPLGFSLPGGVSAAHPWSGSVPRMFGAFLECDTADLNYNAGDRVPLSGYSDAAAAVASSAWADATNVGVRLGNTYTIGNKATAGFFNITPANWRIVLWALR